MGSGLNSPPFKPTPEYKTLKFLGIGPVRVLAFRFLRTGSRDSRMFPKRRGALSGVCIIRVILSWGLYEDLCFVKNLKCLLGCQLDAKR